MSGPGGLNYLNMLPDFTNNWDLAVAVFVMPLAVQWWAVWYPGAEPGGGSYIAQRMLASKTEKDALGGTLFFNIAHYVLRPWPWILVGLASLIVYPQLSDIQKAFPQLDPCAGGPRHRLSRDAEVSAGRLDGTDARRPDRGQLFDDSHASELGRLVPGARLLPAVPQARTAPKSTMCWRAGWPRSGCSSLARRWCFCWTPRRTPSTSSCKWARAPGLLYLLRWFWWRVTAWCEIAAMISSFGISIAFLFLHKGGIVLGTERELALTVLFTTICWLATAYLGPQTDHDTLIAFYRKVHPLGPGWRDIRVEAGVSAAEAAAYARTDNFPLALLGWVTGVSVIWSGLFVVGSFLYGRTGAGLALLAVFLVSGTVLIRVVQKLWH